MTIPDYVKRHAVIGFEGTRFSGNHELRDFLDVSGKNFLDRLEPMFVDLQGFDLGIEGGSRNAKFSSST